MTTAMLSPLSSAVGASVVSAVMFGLGVAYITFYITFDAANLLCTQYTSQVACLSAEYAGCIWTSNLGAQPNSSASWPPQPSCKFSDYETVYCPQYSSYSSCVAGPPQCIWNFDVSECQHVYGMTDTQTGIFAASVSIGAVAGSIVVTYLMHFFSFRTSWLVMIGLMLVGTAFHNISRATNTFALLVVGRVLVGAGINGSRYFASVYAFAVAPDNSAAVTGTLQAVSEYGGLSSALYTYFAMPSNFAVNPHFETRIQAWQAMAYFMLILGVLVGALMYEPSAPIGDGFQGASPLPAAGFIRPLLKHKFKLFVGLTLCALYLFSGFIAVQALTPDYSKNLLGITPAMSVLMVALIATPSGSIAIYIRSRVPKGKPLAVGGGVIIGTFTVLLGIVTYPGVVVDTYVRHILAVAFIVVFYATMEMSIGNTFFGLALELLPTDVRTAGAAFLSSASNCFVVSVTAGFPVAVPTLSGGPTADQMKGYAISMIFIGIVNLMCAAFVGVFLELYPVVAPLSRPPSTADDDPPPTTLLNGLAAAQQRDVSLKPVAHFSIQTMDS